MMPLSISEKSLCSSLAFYIFFFFSFWYSLTFSFKGIDLQSVPLKELTRGLEVLGTKRRHTKSPSQVS